MTASPKLPQRLIEVRDAEARDYNLRTIGRNIAPFEGFKNGFDVCFRALLEVSPQEFDEKAVQEYYESDGDEIGHIECARWQHEQSAAQIAALRTRVTELEAALEIIFTDLDSDGEYRQNLRKLARQALGKKGEK